MEQRNYKGPFAQTEKGLLELNNPKAPHFEIYNADKRASERGGENVSRANSSVSLIIGLPAGLLRAGLPYRRKGILVETLARFIGMNLCI